MAIGNIDRFSVTRLSQVFPAEPKECWTNDDGCKNLTRAQPKGVEKCHDQTEEVGENDPPMMAPMDMRTKLSCTANTWKERNPIPASRPRLRRNSKNGSRKRRPRLSVVHVSNVHVKNVHHD